MENKAGPATQGHRAVRRIGNVGSRWGRHSCLPETLADKNVCPTT